AALKAPATIVMSRTVEHFIALSLGSRHSDRNGPQIGPRMQQSEAASLLAGQPVCQGGIDFACQQATSQRSTEIAASSSHPLADDLRHQRIRQDHWKAGRELPAMRLIDFAQLMLSVVGFWPRQGEPDSLSRCLARASHRRVKTLAIAAAASNSGRSSCPTRF